MQPMGRDWITRLGLHPPVSMSVNSLLRWVRHESRAHRSTEDGWKVGEMCFPTENSECDRDGSCTSLHGVDWASWTAGSESESRRMQSLPDHLTPPSLSRNQTGAFFLSVSL